MIGRDTLRSGLSQDLLQHPECSLDELPDATQDRMRVLDLYAMVVADPLEAPVVGVYFLVCNEDLVYIGKSTNVRARVVGHLVQRKHLFHRVLLLGCAEASLDAYERTLIRVLRPPANRSAWRSIFERRVLEELGFPA